MESSPQEKEKEEIKKEPEEKPKDGLQQEESKNEDGPITVDDLKTPEVEDTPKEKKDEFEIEDEKKEKKEEKKEEYNDINKEFEEIIKKVDEKDSDKTLFNLCDKLKNKYKEKLVKDKIPVEKEEALIKNLNDTYNKYSNNDEYKKIFLEFLFNLYELWPYFYHPDDFSSEIKLENFENPLNLQNYNQLTLLDLFLAIKPKGCDDDDIPSMNILMDKFIMYIYNNYTDYKSLYIENNLLNAYQNRSVFISFKIICLFLFLYKKLTVNKEINISLYIESISSVAKILLQEASYYNQKFNNEYFENAFADFDFNSEDKVKRKLSNEEFKYLTKYLFKFLSIIILTYEAHLEKFDFESDEMRELYWKIFDNELNGISYSLKEKKEINLYTYYIYMSFVLDILAFIYTNFLYVDKTNNEQKEFHFDTYDPFYSFEKTKKNMNPLYHKEFFEYILNDVYSKYHSNIILFIEHFLSLVNLKDEYKEKYDSCVQSNIHGGNYFFIFPMNGIGIAVLLFMINKKNNYKNVYYLYSPLYILDIHLPLIASMFKGGNTLKYLAIDTLISLVKLFHCNAVVPEMKSLTHYSFDDIFNDILSFISSQEPYGIRKYVNAQLSYFIGLLQGPAKKEFFNFYIDRAFKPIEGEHIDDEKTSYFIQIIKNCINKEIKMGKIDYEFWEEKFIKSIFEKLIFSYEKIFIFEIIETISQGLNFIHFMILADKRYFKGSLKIYNREYLYLVRKNVNGIISLVEKFIKSSDAEKYRTLGLHTLTNDEETKSMFQAKNTQCQIMLDLTNVLDNLVSKSLNELQEKEKEGKDKASEKDIK
jgi:hypothetical protein